MSTIDRTARRTGKAPSAQDMSVATLATTRFCDKGPREVPTDAARKLRLQAAALRAQADALEAEARRLAEDRR